MPAARGYCRLTDSVYISTGAALCRDGLYRETLATIMAPDRDVTLRRFGVRKSFDM